MITDTQEEKCSENGGSFEMIQPHRDLELNWGIDLAKNLEDYLLKIYSGEVTNDGHSSVNFAEAAMLLQGSVQVYSRKVEYLYSLVLQALEFISQKGQPEQPENVSEQPEEGGATAAPSNADDFWVPDEIEVDPNCTLDDTSTRDASLDHFVRPPADLVVLEGDGLDVTGDGGELESYLLATSYLYRDFLLLDPRDAAAVDDFLKGDDEVKKGKNGGNRGSSRPSKSYKKFHTPTKRSGGSAHKLSVGKSQDANLHQSPYDGHGFGFNNLHSPPCNIHGINNGEFTADGGYPLGDMDDSDDSEDDPWKPLNPHEPGNLNVKPFRKVKASRRDIVNSSKEVSRTTDFPLASLHGPISSDLTEIWEARCRDREGQQEPQSPPLYEKLRQSLALGGLGKFDVHSKSKDGDEDSGYNSEDTGFEPPIFDMPESAYMNEDVPVPSNIHEDGSAHQGDAYRHENTIPDAIPEDLCRSHVDSLLAKINESEQTELDARVSLWKQRIEQDLEEHEARPAFDIHDYGERVLDKLSKSVDNVNAMSFTDVVRGQEKHDVARSFSVLLQLVNNGNVDLQRSDATNGESTCYTAERPFSVRLLRHAKRRQEVQLRSSKKRALPETKKRESKDERAKSGKENREPLVCTSTTMNDNSL